MSWGKPAVGIPALFTRTSIGPKASSAARTPLPRGVEVGHVEGNGHRPAAQSLGGGCRPLGHEVVDGHRRAGRHQRRGDAGADALTGPGDEGGATGEVEHQGSSLKTRTAFSRRNLGQTWSRKGTSGSSVKMRSRLRPHGK